MITTESDLFLEITYDRLFQILKDILQMYSDYAVTIHENGTIAGIRERILYREELNRLSDTDFNDETISAYRESMNDFLTELDQLEEEAVKEIKNGKMVPVYYIFRLFRFTPFEKLLFLFSFAAASNVHFKRIFALLSDDYDLEYPTVELCTRIFTLNPVERMMLSKNFVERYDDFSILYQDVDTKQKQHLLQGPMMISQRVYSFLWDVASENDELKKFITVCLPYKNGEKLLVQEEILDGIKRICRVGEKQKILYLCGEPGCGRKSILKQFCSDNRITLIMVDCTKLFLCRNERGYEDFIREIALESMLRGDAFVAFTDFDMEKNSFQELEEIVWRMEQYSDFFGFTLNGDGESLPKSHYETIRINIENLSVENRRIVWKYYLENMKEQLSITKSDIKELLDVMPAQYILTPGAIKNSVSDAFLQMNGMGLAKVTREILNEACQKQIAHMLGNDATKIRTIHNFEDLILPASQKKLLTDAVNRIRYRNKVFSEWGFHEKVAYGKGTSMIFYGPPGTGKTMGAQVLAKELGLELYKVDMAKVMSRYVGESEKKLGEIFEHGKKSQSILFFDEADVLFGKRSEVKDSQDKYANASTAYLLQKIEEYEGVIILATNLLQNFDAAFMRRFQFIIEFPFPDEMQRLQIWENVFPGKMPCEELDYEFLAAQFKLSGSQIKNIALSAAFMAAGEKRKVGMADIFKAMKRENSKVGKNMISSDFGGYYYLMEEGDE